MRVIRGRAASPAADREATREVLEEVGDTGVPAVRAWTPHRHLAFGRRDANEPGYEAATAAAEARGFPPVERSVGGRAVAYTGTTVAFASLLALSDPRSGLTERYERAVKTVVSALSGLGIDAEPGEPPDSFCPGDYSVQAQVLARDEAPTQGKVAGIAQRVTADAAMVSGVVVVTDEPEIRDVLDPVYTALEVPFDPASVGSVAAAGGPTQPEPVARALEAAVLDGREGEVECLEATTEGRQG
ncbi:lipoate--protein ligase family protein [Halolamina sp.]|jgi:lipoate-protein ligase A|uniref:lipoyl protein ligase domain-containing protein n=1 Tax=Halolamina sp. TaxID=1940283 RepID=UPI000223B93A|nr:biotin/lipoate A/B protein ligase [halophilic archaeon DL31]